MCAHSSFGMTPTQSIGDIFTQLQSNSDRIINLLTNEMYSVSNVIFYPFPHIFPAALDGLS